jgi:hypothetical protein
MSLSLATMMDRDNSCHLCNHSLAAVVTFLSVVVATANTTPYSSPLSCTADCRVQSTGLELMVSVVALLPLLSPAALSLWPVTKNSTCCPLHLRQRPLRSVIVVIIVVIPVITVATTVFPPPSPMIYLIVVCCSVVVSSPLPHPVVTIPPTTSSAVIVAVATAGMVQANVGQKLVKRNKVTSFIDI